jgi:hypothetical protein
MWEIILLGLILMAVGVNLPILVPVGMLVCAAGLVLGVGAKAKERGGETPITSGPFLKFFHGLLS